MTVASLRRVSSLIAVALATVSCSGKAFRPLTPRTAADADVRASVESIYVTKFPGGDFDEHFGLRLAVEAEQAPGVSLGRARLSSTRLAPCASGVPATEQSAIRAQAPEPAPQVLAFSRPAGAPFFEDGTAALDLIVFPADRSQPAHCLRIPLVEPGPGDAWVHHAFLLGGEERVLVLHSNVPGLQSPALLLGLSMGAWQGRWRWMIEGEGGFADRADASPTTDASTALFGLWGGGASAGRLLFTHGHFGLDAVGGYELLRGVPSGGVGALPPSLTLHGPRLGLRFLYLVDPLQWPRFRSPLDASTGGLAVYVGDWWNGTALTHPSPFVAFGLEGNVGF